MASKLGKEYLQRAGADLEMVRDLRRAKTQRREGGQKVILHKFIKEVCPSYKFYKVHAELTKQLQRVIDGDCRRLIIQIPPRTGKLCADETPVLTLNGWKTHGELCVGDHVFSPSGAPVRVKAISGKAEAKWKVTLSNNDEIWCHGNHEWTVELVSNQKKVVWTKQTDELAKRKLCSGPEGKRGSKYLFHLPNVSQLQFPAQDLLLDPYLLGAWLGDGTTGKPVITHHVRDMEVVDAFIEKGYRVSRSHEINGGSTRAASFGGERGKIGALRLALRATGVEYDKHIPDAYVYSSIDQRLQLLAGLIDTDGCIDRTGRYHIANTNKRIVDSTVQILVSLGQRPYVSQCLPCTSSSGIVGKKTVYSITWQPSIRVPVRIPRKKNGRIVENRRRVAITNIEYCESSQRVGKCIEVDSPNGLYLVGKNLTPTHNSMISSKLFPAAYLIAHPDRYVGISSYSAELAEGFSRAARDYYRESGGTFDPYKQAVNDWGTQGGGGLWAAGVGGAITGRSGHCLIIDDPVKNREDADSPRLMEKLWDWYTSTLYTRLEPGVGSIVVIQTRWSENDLIGKLLESEMNVSEKGRENWTILDLPAMSEDLGSRPILPDHCNVPPDWREEPGLALCPQRYDADEYDRIREAIGTRDFAALYQQRPAPEGGNMFDPSWWQYYEHDTVMPEFQRVMLSVDCTFTDANNSDFVVGTVVGQAGNRYYILDMVRERLDIIGTISMISRMYNKHSLSGTIIELAASGYAAYQLLSKKVPGLIGFKPERSKTARAAGIVPIVEAGNVFLPASSTWLDAFINEFALFPASKNDDIVDSVGMAINYMSQRSAPMMTEVTWGRGVSLLNVPANIVI